MPTYQYACTTCAEQVEVVQRFSDDPLTVCPACGGALRKVFSPVGIVFKGSGFYRTDSRQAAKTGANGDRVKDDRAKDDKTDDRAKDGKAKEGKGKETAESGTAAAGSSGDAKKPSGAKSSPAVGASSSTH